MGDISCNGGVCVLGSRLHLRYCKQWLNGEEINPRELSESTEGWRDEEEAREDDGADLCWWKSSGQGRREV